jgi:hypothetical protein
MKASREAINDLRASLPETARGNPDLAIRENVAYVNRRQMYEKAKGMLSRARTVKAERGSCA